MPRQQSTNTEAIAVSLELRIMIVAVFKLLARLLLGGDQVNKKDLTCKRD